ncbi:LysR family transcriptional regulator [Virgisporangium aliadipatigenens]|uniref:LysR family transcriptional regulator n=1 Tax=Virgisporangium aliadipatigenens TaxID=741659 RepID=A0A8J4DS16_9ACTN|nr:LysR family transcriptional regulator [Virgisporangium aliadipatigenens]GIJ48249.1 LysR family transcriptional regulator [Virgisporangium aliadipatigenens]
MAELDLLATFLEIYRRGSLSAAATARGLSQPAVSGQLLRLERRLGAPLFVRSARGTTPTAAAHALARRVGPHLDGLRDAVDSDGAVDAAGTVRLGGPADLLAARVLPALAPLAARGVRLLVTCGVADDLLAALSRDDLDLVVSAVRPTARTLSAVPLIDEEFVLVGPPALVRGVDPARLATDPVRALSHLPLVAFAPELPIVRRYWRTEFGRRPPNDVAVVVPDLRAVLAAVVAGAGISVLPRYLATAALASGAVVELHRPQVQPLNTLYLATQRAGPGSTALTAVERELRDRAAAWGSL